MTFEFNGKQYVAITSGRSPLAKRRGGQHPRAQRTAERDRAVRVRAMKTRSLAGLIATLAVGTAAAQALRSPMEALVAHDAGRAWPRLSSLFARRIRIGGPSPQLCESSIHASSV